MCTVCPYRLTSQHLSSARSIGIAAATAEADDIGALDWNPACLAGLGAWEAYSSGFVAPSGGERSPTFQIAGIAHSFLPGHAAALRISPGIALEFIVPATFTLQDSLNSFTTSFDRKISYTEMYAAGYGMGIGPDLSAGVSVHAFRRRISDTRVSVDTNAVIRTSPVDYTGDSWSVDAGAVWSPAPGWRIAATGKNLFEATGSRIPDEFREDDFTPRRLLRGGAAAALGIGTASIDADTKGQIRLGGEGAPASGVVLRGGLYLDASSSPFFTAAAAGAEVSFGPLAFNASYLRFTSHEDRTGTAGIKSFREADIDNIEFNRFTPDRVSLSVRVNLARSSVRIARIEDVTIAGGIFAAAQPTYAFRPLGTARVRNTSDRVIDARVSFYAGAVMNSPTESKPLSIAPGAVQEVPLYAVFDDRLRAAHQATVHEAEVSVRAEGDPESGDRVQAHLLVHGPNDWNGDAGMLRLFVAPDDPDVLKFTRRTLYNAKERLDTLAGPILAFEKARVLFDEFASGLLYVDDPRKSEDRVQYPSETISIRGGDCDDLAVCIASLLAGIGIPSAFVDVVPPGRADSAHVYLMFDSGVEASASGLLSPNPKKCVVRANEHGVPTVWIPVETTAIAGGFDRAWSRGAEEYFDDVELNLGIARGWVRLVDIGATD